MTEKNLSIKKKRIGSSAAVTFYLCGCYLSYDLEFDE